MEFNNKEIRFEKKWIFSLNDKFILLNILKKKGFFFKKSFPNRRVNNLYYDTKNFKSLADNLNGISSREKLRARWYGEFSKSKSIFIEKKIKQNQIGYKNKYNLTHEVDFTDLKSINKLNKYIRNTFSLSNQQVVPVLFNNYERRV